MQINRLLWTDQTEHQEKMKKLRQSGETQLSVIESEKWKKIQKEHGIKTNAFTVFLNLFQGLILVCWTGLVQRFSFNVEDYPEIMTGGFLWFKDLSMTDPYFLLPLFNSLIIMITSYVRKSYILIYLYTYILILIEYQLAILERLHAKSQKTFIHHPLFFRHYYVHLRNRYRSLFLDAKYYYGLDKPLLKHCQNEEVNGTARIFTRHKT